MSQADSSRAQPPQGELSRRERKKLELRARVLEAAKALFDERGFAATRVSEICERADVAEKTFFNHFPSKQDVVRSLVEESIAELVAQIEAIRKEPGTFRDHLLEFFGGVAGDAAESNPLHRELLTEMIHAMHEGGAEDDAEGRHVRLIHDAFAEFVQDGVAAGEISSRYAAATLTDAILGSFYSIMFNWAHREDYPIRERAAETALFLADAIAAEPSSEASRR